MSAPTEGPWKGITLPGGDHLAVVSVATPRTRIALVPNARPNPPDADLCWPTAEEAAANARLIIAAPLMYQLLREMLTLEPEEGDEDDEAAIESQVLRTAGLVAFIEGDAPVPADQLQ